MDDRFKNDVDAVGRVDAVPLILDVVCRATGMGFAAIARVTEEHWIACAVRDEIHFGLTPGGELDINSTICDEIRVHRKIVVIDDVEKDAEYCKHHTPAKYGFKSYISVPIHHKGGEFFGTLCAIDPKPARASRPEIVGMFKLFADLLGFYLDAQDSLAKNEQDRMDQQEIHRLRDQFIAVLGHDLRNPLASIDAGARILGKAALDDKSKSTLTLMQKSVKRMSELIDNVLDFARGRLGAGIAVKKTTDVGLAPELEQVVSEIRSSSPDRVIVSNLDITTPVHCDSFRISQLLSNLMANALTHGRKDGPVTVSAKTPNGRFELSVSNQGAPIPQEIVANLFAPFSRAVPGSRHQGLGLGLYIASEIAKAHGGRIDLKTDAAETRFTFTMSNGQD